jgi:hypothetical protein
MGIHMLSIRSALRPDLSNSNSGSRLGKCDRERSAPAGPPVDPIGSRNIDMALNQIRSLGQRHHKGGRFIIPFQHQFLDPGGKAQQGPQFDDRLQMLILHHLKSSGGLPLENGLLDTVVSWPKDQVIHPQARVIEERAPFCLLLELGDHLPHNISLEGLSEQAPKHELSS